MSEHKYSDTTLAARAMHLCTSFGRFVQPTLQQVETSSQVVTGESSGNASDQLSALSTPLSDCILRRFSNRCFGSSPITLEILNAILFAGYGPIEDKSVGTRRPTPSAGALYPLRLFVWCRNVEGLQGQVCEYDSAGALIPVSTLSRIKTLSSYFHTQHIEYSEAAAVIFVFGSFEEICSRYGDRGYRYLLLEAGHAVQSMCLACAALEVPGVPVGAFDDDSVNASFGFDDSVDCRALYALVLGQR